ncbi:MAG: hypothetical protein OT477_22415 [Chloroflexi bacterium]|nr:hypothetical protein [Chloroflexota bacterium]
MNLSAQTKKTLLWTFVSGILCGLMAEIAIWYLGLVFGVLFGIVNITKVLPFVFFTIASGIVYYIAMNTFLFTSGFSFVFGGLCAGLLGGFLMSVVNKVVVSKPLSFGSEIRSTLIGGITGMIFALIFFNNVEKLPPSHMSLAFVIWQVPVGWSLTTSIQTNPDDISLPYLW